MQARLNYIKHRFIGKQSPRAKARGVATGKERKGRGKRKTERA